MSQSTRLSPKIIEEVANFVENSQPARLSCNLRGLLLNMLQVQRDGYIFDLDDLLFDLTQLYALLDIIEDEG